MKASTVALVVGGLAAAGLVVYCVSEAQRDRPIGGGASTSTLGNTIAALGGKAIATLGSEIGGWTMDKIRSIFGGEAKPGGDASVLYA